MARRVLPTEIKVFKIDTCMDEAPSSAPRDYVVKSICPHNSHDLSKLKALALFENTLVRTVHTLVYLELHRASPITPGSEE